MAETIVKKFVEVVTVKRVPNPDFEACRIDKELEDFRRSYGSCIGCPHLDLCRQGEEIEIEERQKFVEER